LRHSPQEDVAQYLPFLNYLEQTTGYHFKLHFTPKNTSIIEELGENKVQFALMGAKSFIQAQIEYDAKILVRGVNLAGKAEYQSVFVVHPRSSIENISSFKGASIAFGNKNSTQGHLIPRIMLNNNNISLSDLKEYKYTHSHQACAEAIISSKYDICGMQDVLAEKLAAQGKLKIIHRSEYFPSSGFAVNNQVPPNVVSKVLKALIAFKPTSIHSKGLYHWQQTEMPLGFIQAKNNDYSNLKLWAIKLGILSDKAVSNKKVSTKNAPENKPSLTKRIEK